MALKTSQKLFNIFKGWNTSSSELSRNDQTAADLRNVSVDFAGRLRKRVGSLKMFHGQTNQNKGGLGIFTYYTSDSSGNDVENVIVNDTQLWKVNSGSTDYQSLENTKNAVSGTVTIDHPFTGITQRSADKTTYEHPSYYSVDGNLYINTGFQPQFKYDGLTLYKSGLPIDETSVISGSSVAGPPNNIVLSADNSVIWRHQYFYVDNNLNTIEGNVSDPQNPQVLTAGNYASVRVRFGVPHFARGYRMNYGRVQTGSGGGAGTDTFTVDGVFAFGTHPNPGTVLSTLYANLTVCVKRRVVATGAFESEYVDWYRVQSFTDLGGGLASVKLMNLDGTGLTAAQLFRQNVGDIISCMAARVWRNEDGGTTYFLVDEMPISPTSPFDANDEVTDSAWGYDDSVTDAILPTREFFTEYDEGREQAPKAKYATVWRNQAILAGDPMNADTLYWASYQGNEYVSANLSPNNTVVGGAESGNITGLGVLGTSLFVFKDRSIYRVTGELRDDNFRIDQVPHSEIGCVAHHTIKESAGKLFFLTKKGIFSLTEDGILNEETSAIREEFFKLFRSVTTPFYFKRAVAVNWREKDKYLLYLPSVTNTAGATTSQTVYENATDTVTASVAIPTEIIALDYYTGFISRYTRLNWLGGVTLKNDVPFFVSNILSSGAVLNVSYTFRDDTDTTTTDYVDSDKDNATTVIPFTYKSAWHSLGEPSLFKKFLRLKLYATAPIYNAQSFTMTVKARLDLQDSIDSTSTTMQLGSGTAPFPPFSAVDYQERTIKFRVCKGRFIRIYMENFESAGVNIDGYEIEYVVPFQFGIKE